MALKFEEKDADYVENIITDGDSVEFDIPNHAQVEEAKYLMDYKVVS